MLDKSSDTVRAPYFFGMARIGLECLNSLFSKEVDICVFYCNEKRFNVDDYIDAYFINRFDWFRKIKAFLGKVSIFN